MTVYTPNAQSELTRLDYRADAVGPGLPEVRAHPGEDGSRWSSAATSTCRTGRSTWPIPGPNRGNAGFTDEERAGFDRILAAGFVDTFREFEPGGGHYTWWSNRKGVRERNIGWRIDYFLVSGVLRPRLRRRRHPARGHRVGPLPHHPRTRLIRQRRRRPAARPAPARTGPARPGPGTARRPAAAGSAPCPGRGSPAAADPRSRSAGPRRGSRPRRPARSPGAAGRRARRARGGAGIPRRTRSRRRCSEMRRRCMIGTTRCSRKNST